MSGPYRVIEVVRELDDALEFARQIHDMNHGDTSLMNNTDKALIILYRELTKPKPKRGRPKKKEAS